MGIGNSECIAVLFFVRISVAVSGSHEQTNSSIQYIFTLNANCKMRLNAIEAANTHTHTQTQYAKHQNCMESRWAYYPFVRRREVNSTRSFLGIGESISVDEWSNCESRTILTLAMPYPDRDKFDGNMRCTYGARNRRHIRKTCGKWIHSVFPSMREVYHSYHTQHRLCVYFGGDDW